MMMEKALAERIDERVRAWGVAVERTLETESSVVLFGTAGDRGEGTGDSRQRRVVLKVVRREGDEWRSGEVLEAFGGRGMVHVHAHVPGAVLLERLDPATELAGMALGGRDEEATEILSDVIARMSPAGCDLRAFPSVEHWGKGFGWYRSSGDERIPRDLVEHGERVYAELCASQRERRLLHGDLQHYNVLFDGRRGWIAIDPKGVVGEAEYEVGALLRNPDRPELYASRAVVERRIRCLEARLKLDGGRMLAWGFAQAVLSVIWGAEDGYEVNAASPPLRVARTIQPMLG